MSKQKSVLKHEFVIKSWSVTGLSSGDVVDAMDEIFFTIHESLPDENTLGQLLGVSEPYPVGRDGTVTGITDSINIADPHLIIIVVHSVLLGRAFGTSDRCLLDSHLPSQTIQSDIEIDFASFSTVKFTCNIACRPEVRILYFPLPFVVGDFMANGGIVLPHTSTGCTSEYAVQMRLVKKGGKCLEEIRRDEIFMRSLQEYKLFPSILNDPLELVFQLPYEEIHLHQVAIQIIDQVGEKLIMDEEIRLDKLILEKPACVGKFRNGLLLMTLESLPERIQTPPVAALTVGEWRFVTLKNFHVSIDFVPDNILVAGVVEYCLMSRDILGNTVAYMETLNSVPVCTTNRSGSFSMKAATSNGGITSVVAILLRDQHRKLFGIYTVPLVDNDRLCLDGEEFIVSVQEDMLEDEVEQFSFVVPTGMTGSSDMPNPKSMIRMHFVIESGTNFHGTNMDRLFVEFMSVSMTVPPVLIRELEVLRIRDATKPDLSASYGRSQTVSRLARGKRKIIWENNVSIDITWAPHMWGYLIVYGQTGDELVSIGHACFPLESVYRGIKRFSLPVIKSEEGATDIIPQLHVSVPKEPEPWSPLFIYQDPKCRLERLEELRVDVKVFMNAEVDEGKEIRAGHVWLPIKDVYPLYIRDCPPSGVAEMRISTLKGYLVDSTTFEFNMREKWDITCKGIHFIFTRSSNRPFIRNSY